MKNLELTMKIGDLSLGLIENDPGLKPFERVLIDRYRQVVLKELEFTNGQKTLADCCNTHLYYGLHADGDYWVFREWAPNATAIYLTGEFNDWYKTEARFALNPIGGGNWELRIPKDVLKHGMLYRLWVEWNGGAGHRLPSHVVRAVQDEYTKIYCAQVWDPKPFKWHKPKLPKLSHPLIYEAHIGMSTELKRVSSFEEFRAYVLPRIIKAGYNTIQLMGIQEHPYYGSFGYQVSNFFGVSSRFGTPEELKKLIDEAHRNGIRVIMDLVHSHAVKNEEEGLSNFAGDLSQYFYEGDRGYHSLWNSRCFNYGKNPVIAFLLSNCKYWLEEYHFDGFRFDGITSMLYWDHGLGKDFTEYKFYYDGNQDSDAITYLSLANKLIHSLTPLLFTIQEWSHRLLYNMIIRHSDLIHPSSIVKILHQRLGKLDHFLVTELGRTLNNLYRKNVVGTNLLVDKTLPVRTHTVTMTQESMRIDYIIITIIAEICATILPYNTTIK